MPLSHNQIVARRFAAHAGEYERHARLQADIAGKLAEMLPALARPRVLEVGCGTGFLTGRLLEKYPDGDFLVTDIAPEMVDICRARHQRANGRALRFAVMDGEAPYCGGPFDLVSLSMTAQWFVDPVPALKRLSGLLAPSGMLVYATLAPGGFPEWRKALEACGLHSGLIEMPSLPGVVREETRTVDYGGGVIFLDALRAIGATTPRPGYRPLPPGKLRAALARLERDHGARVTWRIAYGVIGSGSRDDPPESE